jgi:hypothetical protein
MEHRWNDRKPVQTDVIIHAAGLGMIRGRTRDLSMSGAFIETAPAVTVHKNSRVQVAFLASGKTVPAHITRTRNGGFGVLFDDVWPETRHALTCLLEAGSLEPVVRRPHPQAVVG